MYRKLVLMCFVLLFALASSSYGDVVIGDWETDADGEGWIDWSEGQAAIEAVGAPKYVWTTEGATLGSGAIQVTANGWQQNLSIKLQDVGMVDAFLANTAFAIDFSVPADATEGWNQIYTVSLNAQDFGWNDLGDKPKQSLGFPSEDLQTVTVIWDYTDALASIPEAPTYVEFILATNSDGVHNTFYFDNARLVPEPATIALLGLGGLALLRRKRQ